MRSGARHALGSGLAIIRFQRAAGVDFLPAHLARGGASGLEFQCISMTGLGAASA